MSRLTRKIERQTKKTIFLSIIGIITLTLLVWKFSFLFLDKLGSLNTRKQTADLEKSQVNKEVENFLSAPILEALPSATNSAVINVSGHSINKNGLIELFINNDPKAQTAIKDNSSFIFSNVTLENGQNIIKVRLKNASGKTSDFSDYYIISYSKDLPKLEIKFPAQGATFTKDSKTVNIQGITDPNNKITVGNYWAIVDSQGNFSYLLPLKDGENNIEIKASNPAGAITSQNLKITYQP